MYVVYLGWAFSVKVAEFKTKKKAIQFILQQENSGDYCYEYIKTA